VGEQLFRPRDHWPPGALIFAVRAGRNATLESPNDPNGYITLAQAYEMCLEQEDRWVRRPPNVNRPFFRPELRVQLRIMQITHALHSALITRPDDPQVHNSLHELYMNLGYIDLALDHLALARKGLDSRKPASNEQMAAIEQLKVQFDKRLKELGEEVKRRRDAFNLETGSQQNIGNRFELALVDPQKADAQGKDQKVPRGLIKLGLQILLDARLDAFKDNPAGLNFLASWQLYLLLTTGQAREAYSRLEAEELRNILPGGQYEELRALAAAALGDYVAADIYLQKAEQARNLLPDQQLLDQQQKAAEQLAENLAKTAAWAPASGGETGILSPLGLFYLNLPERVETLMQSAKERRDVADLRLIRGALALESGDTKQAARHFRMSADIVPPLLPIALAFTDRPIAQRYLELLEAR
jgi:hypothetical protein